MPAHQRPLALALTTLTLSLLIQNLSYDAYHQVRAYHLVYPYQHIMYHRIID